VPPTCIKIGIKVEDSLPNLSKDLLFSIMNSKHYLTVSIFPIQICSARDWE
jgi:hypothetical protein